MTEPEPYCEACQLPLVMCAHRNAGPPRSRLVRLADVDWDAIEAAAEEDDGPVLEALYHGTCPLCGSRWEPGASIRRYAAEDSYAHAECVDETGDG
jgi:hypothetical protein